MHDYSYFPDDNVLRVNSDADPWHIDGEPHPFHPKVTRDAFLDHDDLLLVEETPNTHDKMIGNLPKPLLLSEFGLRKVSI